MTNREKLIKIRKLLKEAYDHYFDNCQDCGCKSGEGHISLEFGNYWEDPNCELNITSVCIGSYVFGPHRTHCFNTLDEALAEVSKWYEEEMKTVYTLDDEGYPTSYWNNPDYELLRSNRK
jgi:hypothetical protein